MVSEVAGVSNSTSSWPIGSVCESLAARIEIPFILYLPGKNIAAFFLSALRIGRSVGHADANAEVDSSTINLDSLCKTFQLTTSSQLALRGLKPHSYQILPLLFIRLEVADQENSLNSAVFHRTAVGRYSLRTTLFYVATLKIYCSQ